MKRVPLPADAVDQLWEKLYEYQELSGEPTTIRHTDILLYYRSLAWDLTWEQSGQGWAIPDNQLAFFLLSL